MKFLQRDQLRAFRRTAADGGDALLDVGFAVSRTRLLDQTND
jgi:hypothetical protein